MKYNIFVSLILFISLAAMALAQDVVGKWSGKLEVQLPKNVTVNAKESDLNMPKVLVDLTLNANKTFVQIVDDARAEKKSTIEGTWTLTGKMLVLKPLKRDGKPVTGAAAADRTYTLSKDGKTLTMDLSAKVKAKMESEKGTSNLKSTARMVLKRA